MRFVALRRDAPLPDFTCVVVEKAHGCYFVNAYVETATGGYVSAHNSVPFETQREAMGDALIWAEAHGVDEVHTIGFEYLATVACTSPLSSRL